MSTQSKGFIAIVALCAWLAWGVATAPAADWHTSGLAYTATATTGANIRVGAVTIACTRADITGIVNPSPPPGTNPYNTAMTMSYVFSGCMIGVDRPTISCAVGTYGTLLGPANYAGPGVAPADAGLSGGRFYNISCTVTIAPNNCSVLTGMVNALHRNPDTSRVPAVVGDITFSGPGAGQAFTMANLGAGCMQIPAGATTIGSPGGGGLLFRYNAPAAPAAQPFIWWG